MKKLLLLPLLLVGCKSTPTQRSDYHGYGVLGERQTLYIYFYEPIVEVDHIIVEFGEINWYKWDTEWFILDYKNDPGTYYIDIDNISLWGIER